MSRLYGHKFVSNFGTSDDGTWLMALAGLRQGDLSRGMTELINLSDEWPPSVPRFKQLCLGIRKEDIRIRAEAIAIEYAGGTYNYSQLSVSQCRSRINEVLEQASHDLTKERIEMAVNGVEIIEDKTQKRLIPKDNEYHGKEI